MFWFWTLKKYVTIESKYLLYFLVRFPIHFEVIQTKKCKERDVHFQKKFIKMQHTYKEMHLYRSVNFLSSSIKKDVHLVYWLRWPCHTSECLDLIPGSSSWLQIPTKCRPQEAARVTQVGESLSPWIDFQAPGLGPGWGLLQALGVGDSRWEVFLFLCIYLESLGLWNKSTFKKTTYIKSEKGKETYIVLRFLLHFIWSDKTLAGIVV